MKNADNNPPAPNTAAVRLSRTNPSTRDAKVAADTTATEATSNLRKLLSTSAQTMTPPAPA
ncbi:MAG: hypothetical protein LBI02_11975 [Opitutaceae bacterium]|nr:hypothetical protein [Opitutaceae bacterium]